MGRGRPRKMDPEVVLDRAMKVFWDKGFEATSMSDLVTTTGMAKPGLYACFGDKEELYKKSLTRYVNEIGAPLLNDLKQSRDPLKVVLRRFFDNIAHSLMDKETPCGCFVVNSLVEGASQSPALIALGRDINEKRRQAFVECFEQAQARGDIPTDANAKALGEFFSAQSLALGVLARSGSDQETLTSHIDVAMTLLP